MPDNWGVKFTIHMYFADDDQPLNRDELIDWVNRAWPEAHFIGIEVRPVEEEPTDQIAS